MVKDGAGSVLVSVFGFVIPFFEQSCRASDLPPCLRYPSFLFLYDVGIGREVSRFLIPEHGHPYHGFLEMPAKEKGPSSCAKCRRIVRYFLTRIENRY